MTKAFENAGKLQRWVDPISLGAKGDGVTNDTAAIQAAINSLTTGTVRLAAGSYLCDRLTLKSGVSIIGEGAASKFIVSAGAGDFLVGDVSNVILADFYIDGSNQPAGGGCGMNLKGFADSMIRGVTVYNVGSFGWLILKSLRSKYIGNTVNKTRKWDGMTISTDSVDNVIQGNTVIDSYDSGIGLTDTLGTVCIGNVVRRSKINGEYFAPGIDAAGAKNATISGNYVLGNKFGISLLQHPNSGSKPKRISVTGNTVADGQYGIMTGLVQVLSGAQSENTTMDGMVISGNTIFSQDVAGIHIDNTFAIQVIGNSVSYCGNGIEQASADRSVIHGNSVRANANGIHVNLDSLCTNMSVAFNRLSDNTMMQITGVYGDNPYFAHNHGAEVGYNNTGHDPIPQAFVGCAGIQFGSDTSLTVMAAAPNKDGANFAAPAGFGATTIKSQSPAAASNSWFHFVGQSGNGTAPTSNRILISGDGNVQNANNSYGGISDARLKTAVVDANPKLADLMRVRIVNYELKSDPGQKLLGVVAQELEQIFPGMVDETADVTTNADGEVELTGTTTKSVKYSVFVPMLVKALQEATARIEALEAKAS